jgi:hypothetical protein
MIGSFDMATPRRKRRKIVVADTTFQWTYTASVRGDGTWRVPKDEDVDPQWQQNAARFGLGSVIEIYQGAIVALWENPASLARIVREGFLVDGFMGIEPLEQITPKDVREMVELALENGWEPEKKGHPTFILPRKSEVAVSPPLLVLPGFNVDIEGYENHVPVKLLWKRDNPADSDA